MSVKEIAPYRCYSVFEFVGDSKSFYHWRRRVETYAPEMRRSERHEHLQPYQTIDDALAEARERVECLEALITAEARAKGVE